MNLILRILKKIKRLLYRRPHFISYKFLRYFFKKNKCLFLYVCEDISNLNYVLNIFKKNIQSKDNLLIIYLDDPTDRDLLGCTHIENDYDNLLISFRKFKTGKVDAYNRVPIAYGFLFQPNYLVWLNKNNLNEINNVKKIQSSIDKKYNIYISSKDLFNNFKESKSAFKILHRYSINQVSEYDFSSFLIFYKYSILRQIGLLPSSIYPDNLLLLRLNGLYEIKLFNSNSKQKIKRLSFEINSSYLKYIDRHADIDYIDEFFNLYSSSIYKRCIQDTHIVESEKTIQLELEHKEKFSKLLVKS